MLTFKWEKSSTRSKKKDLPLEIWKCLNSLNRKPKNCVLNVKENLSTRKKFHILPQILFLALNSSPIIVSQSGEIFVIPKTTIPSALNLDPKESKLQFMEAIRQHQLPDNFNTFLELSQPLLALTTVHAWWLSLMWSLMDMSDNFLTISSVLGSKSVPCRCFG